jgi:hypothetical protein
MDEAKVKAAQLIDELLELGILRQRGMKIGMPPRVISEILMRGAVASEPSTPFKDVVLRGCALTYLARKAVASYDDVSTAAAAMSAYVMKVLEKMKPKEEAKT